MYMPQRKVESEDEKKRRRDWYDDKVHVDRDGTVHGNPRDAWEHALQDTGLRSKPEPSFAEWLLSVQSILDSKNFADWLMGFKDANTVRLRFEPLLSVTEGDPLYEPVVDLLTGALALNGGLFGAGDSLLVLDQRKIMSGVLKQTGDFLWFLRLWK